MKRIALIDYARFFAAMSVVIYHYTLIAMTAGKVTTFSIYEPLTAFTRYGYLGVELFFMISGYVIFYSAHNRKASEFAASRALRLLPAYWFAIIFTATITYLWGRELFPISLQMVAANFTMAQSLMNFPHVDGAYWTLLYEAIFYFAVFLLLLLGVGKKIDLAFIVWPWIMLVAQLSGAGEKHLLGGYYFYFAAGALFALLKERQNPYIIASLVVSFIMSLIFSTQHSKVGQPIPAACIIICFYAFFIFLTFHKSAHMKLPKSNLLGALTYPVYLIHGYLGYIVFNKFGTPQNQVWLTLLMIVVVLLIAYFIHQIIELRLAGFWRRLFDRLLGVPLRFIEVRLNKKYLSNIINWRSKPRIETE